MGKKYQKTELDKMYPNNNNKFELDLKFNNTNFFSITIRKVLLDLAYGKYTETKFLDYFTQSDKTILDSCIKESKNCDYYGITASSLFASLQQYNMYNDVIYAKMVEIYNVNSLIYKLFLNINMMLLMFRQTGNIEIIRTNIPLGCASIIAQHNNYNLNELKKCIIQKTF